MNSDERKIGVAAVRRMRNQINLLENVHIPQYQQRAEECRREGRYATATAYYNLIADVRRDVEAYQRSVDCWLRAFARDEFCHSPLPEGSRSEGLTKERADS